MSKCKCNKDTAVVKTALCIATEEYDVYDDGDSEPVAGTLEIAESVELLVTCKECDNILKKQKFGKTEAATLKLVQTFLNELKPKQKYQKRVVFGDDYVQILDSKGKEILYWDIKEWTDDPQVLFLICNAIVMLFTQGEDALKKTLMPKG